MKKKIKVLNVLLDDRIGGAHIRIFRIAKKLKERGIEYSLAAPKGKGETSDYAGKAEINVYRCSLGTPHFIRNSETLFLNISYIINFIPSIYCLAKIIKKKEIDIVHLHGLLNLKGALAALFTKRLIVWHFHETLYPQFLIKILRPFTNFAAENLVHISKNTRNYYLTDPNPKEVLIYEPVDTEEFGLASIKKERKVNLRKELNISENDIVLGSVGNISWVKGYENLIISMGALKKKHKNLKLLIIGKILSTQAGYYKQLKRLASSMGLEQDIYFLGQRDDIPQLLSLTDIFILPSLTEGTPLSILEAMSMKLPVIASRVGGVPEVVSDGKTGLLVNPGNPDEITDAVLKLLKNPKIRKEMGAKARKIAKKKFALEHCVREHEKLYKRLINR
ncbi:glycosyltransferase family 4 protein [candidate division WOR-3 bacterium]|nr:glycosyltransferase family 4 protein [candidate division WOR-3 bacterium]